jgi:hypothetical protein
MKRLHGQVWLDLDEAAERLGVQRRVLERRIGRPGAGGIPVRYLGEHDRALPHISEAAVERYAVDGLPYPELEAHEAGEAIPVPGEWLESNGCGFIALRPMTLGPSGRHVNAGDVLAADELEAIHGEWHNPPTVARLPLDRGVLGLVRQLTARLAELEAQR